MTLSYDNKINFNNNNNNKNASHYVNCEKNRGCCFTDPIITTKWSVVTAVSVTLIIITFIIYIQIQDKITASCEDVFVVL